MENIKLGGLEIKIKLDDLTAEELRNTITYIFSDLINIDSKTHKDQDELEDNKNTSNIQIEASNLEGEITDKQLKYIHLLAKEKGIDKESLQNYSISMFGKNSSLELTKHEASKLIAALNDIEYNVLDHLKV